MKAKKKISVFVAVLAVAFCGTSMAGSRINAWMIDDFESYDSTVGGASPLRAYPDFSGGPWWLLQDIQTVINGSPAGIVPTGGIINIELTETADPLDPNGFVAKGENDPVSQAVTLHYDFTNATDNSGGQVSYWSCDLFRFSSSLGIPFRYERSSFPSGHPLEYVPVADMTKYETLSFKIKNASGNTSGRNDLGLGLVGPDAQTIGYVGAVGSGPGGDFLKYPADKWQTVEFRLSSLSDGPSAFGPDMVTGIVIGTGDTLGSLNRATFYVDEIMLYSEGEPCDKYSPADINLDCSVDMADLAKLAAEWLK